MTRNDDANDRTLFRIGTTGLALLVLMSVLAMPAAAQTAAGGMLCDSSGNANNLGSLVNTWLQMMFSIGIVAAIGMYQYETIVGMVTFKQSQKRYMKEKKRDVAKAAIILLGVGPLFSIFVTNTSALGQASCVTFIPWA